MVYIPLDYTGDEPVILLVKKDDYVFKFIDKIKSRIFKKEKVVE